MREFTPLDQSCRLVRGQVPSQNKLCSLTSIDLHPSFFGPASIHELNEDTDSKEYQLLEEDQDAHILDGRGAEKNVSITP